MTHVMKRATIILTLLVIAAFAGIAGVYAASGGHLSASRVIYEAGDETSSLRFEGDVSFDYAGYHFTAKSAEIIIARPEPDELHTDLKHATFSGGVSVSTPTGGRVSASGLTVRRIGSIYEFTGVITYSESDLLVKAKKISFDRSNNTLTATGGVVATYLNPKGIMGDDGELHPVVLKSDGLIYDRAENILKNAGTSRPRVEFDGFIFNAGNIELQLSEDGLLGLAAANDMTVEGRGVTISGLNASYSADTGELRIWGDVRYSKDANEFSGDDVTWYIREDNNRISVTGGIADFGISREDEGEDLLDANE